ncbi:MAG: tetratricopeptide repeat protein [Chitinispirillaceae bacterium]|nr:tetratricopeptide repeat protein [Chitinispirillaceae bacterium]
MKNTILFIAMILSLSIVGCNKPEIEKGAISLNVGDYNRAIRFYDRALNRDPANGIAHLGLGKALFQKAKAQQSDTVSLQQAIVHIEAARTLGVTGEVNGLLSSVLTENARIHLNKEDTVGALESLTRAIEYDQSSSGALNLTGIIYFRTGRAEKAAVLFDYAIRIDTNDVSPLFNRGMVAWNQNQMEIAHEFWFKALCKSPQDEEILYWFARAEKLLRDRQKKDTSGNGNQ